MARGVLALGRTLDAFAKGRQSAQAVSTPCGWRWPVCMVLMRHPHSQGYA